MGRSTYSLLVVLLALFLTSKHGLGQQSGSQRQLQQQQQRQQQQQNPPNQQATRRQSNQNKRPQTVSKDDPDNLRLTQMTPELLNRFLNSEEDIILLTNCFENFGACRSSHAINLINQIRTLGVGGQCPNCTEEEQKHLHNMIYNFVQGFQTRYPQLWRRLLPNIGSLIVNSPTVTS